MSIVEAGVRGGGISLLLLLTALFLRDARDAAAGRYTALFTLCAACDLVGSAPILDDVHAIWLAPMRILASGTAAVFWITVSALFDEEFEAGWPHIGAWLGLVGLGVWGAFATVPWRLLPHHGLALLCLLLAVWSVLAGRARDLDEGRRRLRLLFVTTVGPFTAVITIAGALGRGAESPSFSATDGVGNLALAFFFAAALLSLTPGTLLAPLALAKTRPRRAVQSADGPEDPREAGLLQALRRELVVNRTYREETLTIAALASRVGAPEYRLRHLINQRLGHRNFATFLNGYRIEEAMAALADPGQAEVPILTIALDAGFASIGPFNRAFKARTGQTPSEYRRTQLAESLRG
jgi:AraC-like DNA-binding protein